MGSASRATNALVNTILDMAGTVEGLGPVLQNSSSRIQDKIESWLEDNGFGNPFTPANPVQVSGLHLELTDHLGNVRGVVKGALKNGQADIVSLSDYYPFGQIMPGRNFTSEEYRYGYNGQEKDNEISGTGTSYTAEYWQYDSRLGRRWNVDPVPYAWQSVYAAFNNNPLYFTDPLGNEAIAKDGDPVKKGDLVRDAKGKRLKNPDGAEARANVDAPTIYGPKPGLAKMMYNRSKHWIKDKAQKIVAYLRRVDVTLGNDGISFNSELGGGQEVRKNIGNESVNIDDAINIVGGTHAAGTSQGALLTDNYQAPEKIMDVGSLFFRGIDAYLDGAEAAGTVKDTKKEILDLSNEQRVRDTVYKAVTDKDGRYYMMIIRENKLPIDTFHYAPKPANYNEQ